MDEDKPKYLIELKKPRITLKKQPLITLKPDALKEPQPVAVVMGKQRQKC